MAAWFGGVLMVSAPFAAGAAAPAQIAPTREELQPARAAPPAPSRLEVEGDIERAPCALADPRYAGVKVRLSAVEFGNAGPVDAEALRPAYAPYLGGEQPISALCEIRDAAATILRRKGYLAAVQVPTQRIEDGKVRFEILYARITSIRVRGDGRRIEGLLSAYFNRLTHASVFNRIEAERYLLLARDIPGYTVKLALRPAGTGPGDLVGDVTIVRTPVEVDLNVQDFASRDTGRWGGQLRAQFYGLTGMGDRTSIAFYSTSDFKEQQIVQLGHEFLVGGQGLRLGGHFTYAWTRPDLGAGASVKARTLFANAEASYPFLRGQAANLRGAVGLDLVDQDVDFAGAPLTRDRLRVAYLRLDADAVDTRFTGPGRSSGWRLAGSLELRRGLSILGATHGCRVSLATCLAMPGFIPSSRADGDPTATLLRFSGLAEAKVARNVTLSVSPRMQYAFDRLLSFEGYSAGNYTIGRGYDPGTLIGDSGVGFTAEARLDRVLPIRNFDLTAQPFLFVDNAWVWDRGSLPGRDPRRLSSIGGGVRLNYADRARLDVTLAVPTRAAGLQTRRGDARLLVSLSTRLVPWSAR